MIKGLVTSDSNFTLTDLLENDFETILSVLGSGESNTKEEEEEIIDASELFERI